MPDIGQIAISFELFVSLEMPDPYNQFPMGQDLILKLLKIYCLNGYHQALVKDLDN